MSTVVKTVGLLIVSNTFMTFAWYAHLRNLSDRKWYVAALVSWGIALFEYLFQVPANRIGYQVLTLGQLKIIQEMVTLSVFVPFAIFYMKQPPRWDFLWAGLCICGAAFFMFRAA
ncbi:MAG TPA: DMT family protein [Gemmatimonadaceae bacterium]